jgi:hypothetical protein
MQSNARQKPPKATKNLKRFSRLRGAGGQQKTARSFDRAAGNFVSRETAQ